MEHKHNIIDTDVRFLIDSIHRRIKSESKKITLMQNDHNSERYTFELPRYIEGHDMTLCNKVEVHYLNTATKEKDKGKVATGKYDVEDLQISPEDESKVLFSWLISKNATKYAGVLSFRIKFRCIEDDIETYSWNTDIYADIKINDGINADETFEIEYVDIIEQWKAAVKSEFSAEIDDLGESLKTELSEWEELESGKIRGEMTAYSAQWNQALSVERERIDNIVALPEGSTTGDAELLDIRVGADGVTYDSAGTAFRSQIEIIKESNEIFREKGIDYLKGGFVHGKITNDGTEYDDKYRVKSIVPLRYDSDIDITINSGFRIAIHFYDETGTHLSETGWLTNAYTIKGGDLFRIVIARIEENPEDIANILSYVKAVTITTLMTSSIKKINSTSIALEKHLDNKMHLVEKVLSNNLVNPDEIAEGGYFAYNTGKWIARADISTTGLIPCNSGEIYYCGIDFINIRGGNCSFWNAGGEYISGKDVPDGSKGFSIPENNEIKFFRISFYASEKPKFHINLGEYKEYDKFSAVYSFDKEIETPSFNSSKKESTTKNENTLYYVQTYKENVTVSHKRSDEIGTSYQTTVINKVKFDGNKTSVTIAGTSETNALGDSGNKNVINFAKQNDFLHIINGGIYLVETGEADGITIINGEILKNTGVEQFNNEQYILGITKNGDMKAYINETAENILKDGAIYAITGFVPLIQGGEVVDDSVLAVCPHYNARHPRQIVGVLSDGNYFTFCCDGRTENENGMTLKECIEVLNRDFAIQFAFNLDGGGSSQSTVGKKQINRMIDGRTVPNVIVFK